MAKEFTILYGGRGPQGYQYDITISAMSFRDAAYRYICIKDPELNPDFNMVPIVGPSGKERWIRVPNPDLTNIPLGVRVGERTANKSYVHF